VFDSSSKSGAPSTGGTPLAFTEKKAVGDRIFRAITGIFAFLVIGLALLTAYELFIQSSPALKAMGWEFFTTSDWNPVSEMFGAIPFVYGTLLSSLIALLIAGPLGLGIALFMSELAPQKLKEPVSFLVEILAAIPSVVYGLWGVFLLAPLMRVHVDPFLAKVIGAPFFVMPSTGLSLSTAGVILAIMILPTITAISREVFEAVPNTFRESALALGATRWETIRLAVLKPSQAGILGAVMLGMGRALGETMAVTMVIGNRPEISMNFLDPSHSMASVIANEFTEAMGDVHLSALALIGLLLMGITLLLNIAAHVLVWAATRNYRAVKA
jgi:phosphate transport system permease protein